MTVIMILAGVILAAVLLQIKQPANRDGHAEELLPIWKVENDCILSKNGDVTIAYKVSLPEIFSLSTQDYEALHHAWLKAIKVLPAGCILHKQDLFIQSRYQAEFKHDPANLLAAASERHFNERPFLDHDCLLMLTIKPSVRKISSSAYSNLLRKHITPVDSIEAKAVQSLLDAAGQFVRILSDSGSVGLERLNADALCGTAEKPGWIERYLFLTGSNANPVLKDIVFKPEWKIGENFCQLYSLSDTEHLPETCSPRVNYDKYSTDKTKFSVGFATPLGQLLPVNHIYNQYLIIGDTNKTLKRLEARRKRLHSLSAYSRENSISRDATADFLNESIEHSRTPIRAHFNLLCWTDDPQKIKPMRNLAASALSQINAVPHLETNGAPQLFWAGIPGNQADLPENDTYDTFAEQASCFLNMETAYRSSKSAFGIRLSDRLTGVPVHLDISDLPMKHHVIQNRNKIVVGGSGSGKSMFMNHMLHSYYQQSAHVVIVDVGHSYEGLCKLVGGYYFTYSEDNPIRFNPFFIPEGEILDTEKKESIKTLLVSLWKHHDETFRRSEYVAVSNALQSYYVMLAGNPNIFPCFNSFYEFLQSDFIKELDKDGVKDRDFDVHNFLYVLRPYYRGGEFDFLLNATQNLDIMQQPFIVFELDNLKDHAVLFPVTVLIIMELFISKMRKLKGIRKVIVIEEAWKAIAKTSMAEFIKYLYKTVRKHFGEAITVTQEIDDLISSAIIKEAIINNADCKILLDLKKFQNKFEAIQQVMGISDKGKEQILSVNRANDPAYKYKEIYIELGNQFMQVYRFEPSVEEYYAYTTEQTEKLLLQEYTDKYSGDIRKGLTALAYDLKAKS